MGRAVHSLDVDVFFSIKTAGETVSPWDRNVRICKCAKCEAALEAGHGVRVRKARHADGKSGYLCGKCVSVLLEGVERWYWNRGFWRLYPADEQQKTFDGDTLAQAWNDHGLSGLAFTLNA